LADEQKGRGKSEGGRKDISTVLACLKRRPHDTRGEEKHVYAQRGEK